MNTNLTWVKVAELVGDFSLRVSDKCEVSTVKPVLLINKQFIVFGVIVHHWV